MDELITAEDIAEIALGAAEFSTDGQTAKRHNLKDILEARTKLAESSGAAQPHRGLRFTKLVAPGATGD